MFWFILDFSSGFPPAYQAEMTTVAFTQIVLQKWGWTLLEKEYTFVLVLVRPSGTASFLKYTEVLKLYPTVS